MISLFAVLAMTFVVATPAQASTTTCTNYGCPSNGAWDSARWTSWWGNDVLGTNTPGANCTNYAAWRLINNGASGPMYLGNANTWDDRARNWGYAVNGTPAVGAIAQWNYGTYGHVAYVEAVNGNSITISESNYNGKWLSWRVMDISEVENFIHIKDVGAPASSLTSKFIIGTPDFNGDGFSDIFRVTHAGDLYFYPGNGAGSWSNGAGVNIGGGWGAFAKIVAPGDFDGDGHADIMGILPDGTMRLYSGNGAGVWANGAGTTIGAGFTFPTVLSPGDFNGDGHSDILGIASDGTMYFYGGNGAGGWANGTGIAVGWGFNAFKLAFSPGDFNSDGNADVIAVTPGGTMTLFPGNGAASWTNGAGITIGSGFNIFELVTSPGDFTGDGNSDVMGVAPDGSIYLYRGNGATGWNNGVGEVIGAGF